MNKSISLPEEEILANLCDKYDIKQDLIRELLVIERGYQDHARRRGIYQQITELIKTDLAKEF